MEETDNNGQQNNQQDDKDTVIEGLTQKVSELENNWKRALADYRNYQKRVEEERLELTKFTNALLIGRLIPIFDHLELLDRYINDAGLKMILSDFRELLRDEGLKEVEGEIFDSQTMEAIELVDGEENKVIEVIQKGYFLKDKLIRPARVKVGKERK